MAARRVLQRGQGIALLLGRHVLDNRFVEVVPNPEQPVRRSPLSEPFRQAPANRRSVVALGEAPEVTLQVVRRATLARRLSWHRCKHAGPGQRRQTRGRDFPELVSVSRGQHLGQLYEQARHVLAVHEGLGHGLHQLAPSVRPRCHDAFEVPIEPPRVSLGQRQIESQHLASSLPQRFLARGLEKLLRLTRALRQQGGQQAPQLLIHAPGRPTEGMRCAGEQAARPGDHSAQAFDVDGRGDAAKKDQGAQANVLVRVGQAIGHRPCDRLTERVPGQSNKQLDDPSPRNHPFKLPGSMGHLALQRRAVEGPEVRVRRDWNVVDFSRKLDERVPDTAPGDVWIEHGVGIRVVESAVVLFQPAGAAARVVSQCPGSGGDRVAEEPVVEGCPRDALIVPRKPDNYLADLGAARAAKQVAAANDLHRRVGARLGRFVRDRVLPIDEVAAPGTDVGHEIRTLARFGCGSHFRQLPLGSELRSSSSFSHESEIGRISR
ncbi:MAG: hypothetical protein HYV63_07955 [Candidatus Schekmanbacteria bacterium]|nr:hypothetical protein [Candidatus Schekmanbacteria bacterium]